MIDTYKRMGDEIPSDLIAPEIHDLEVILWSDFWELSTDRPRGMAPGPIPGSVIRSYPSAVPYNVLLPVIRAMDAEFLLHGNERKKDEPFTKDLMKRK